MFISRTCFPPKDSLDRFLDAQNTKLDGYAVALSEIRAGRKSSHWMWYIFPQLRSCMTLFDAVVPDGVFRKVIDAYFEGQLDSLTLSLIHAHKV